MAFFSYISNSYSLKNKLEKGIFEFLKSQDRQVIPNADLQIFKDNILLTIDSINADHPRCKPIKSHWWKGEHNDQHLNLGASITNFSIYASNN